MTGSLSAASPRRVLVTGGNGFIGAHLAQRLAAVGHSVHIAHRPASDLRRLRALDVDAELHQWAPDASGAAATLLAAVRPQIVFNLASDTRLRHIDAARTDVATSIASTVRTALDLAVAACNVPGDLQLFVQVGGLEEYGNGPAPYRETQREQPVSPYSAAQVAITHYVQMLAPQMTPRTVIVRPALIYGPLQSSHFLIPALIDACLAGSDFTLHTPAHGRDLLYVDDLVDVLLRLCNVTVAPGTIINLASGRESIVADIAASIVRLAESPTRLRTRPEPGPGGIAHLVGANDRARALLDWQPRITLDDGLRRTIAAARERP